MVSRIRIGPDGGPYVILDEDNGSLDITTPNGDISLEAGVIDTSELADDSISTVKLQTDSVDIDSLDVPELVVDQPEVLPITELEDTESVELPIVVQDAETLEVYRWGAFDVSDGSVPTGLDVELLDDSDTTQASENTRDSSSTSTPVASYQNSSGTVSIFKLRAKNDTGSAIDSPGVGSQFGYRVV